MQREILRARDATRRYERRRDARTNENIGDVCNWGCKTTLLDGPDCKMATRGIIVRTRDLPSAALSPSQRAAEVAMATDRRKPAPTLLFPRMRAVGFAVSRSLCVKWFCCAVLQPSTTALVLFFSPRIPFPSVFLRGRCALSSLRSLFRASNVVASRCARWSRLSRFFPSPMEFPTNKRTNAILLYAISSSSVYRFWPICFGNAYSYVYESTKA